MAKHDDAIPVEHGVGSTAAITAGEAGKGLFKGAGKGLLGGALIGGIITALAPVALFSMFGASIGTLAVVGLLAAIPGAYFGGMAGLPVGAVVGTGQGVGDGINRVCRDGAAAQMLRTQEMTAQAQAETAQAMQARVMERMMTPPSAPEPVAMPTAVSPYPQPEPKVTHIRHHGQGVTHVPAHAAGAHTQRHHQAQAELAASEQQIG